MKKTLGSKKKFIILLLLFLAQIVCFIDKTAMNFAIIPISKELNLTSDKAGLILSSFFLSYAIMQFVGGYLADKWGVKKVLTGAITIWSIATILTGMARSSSTLIASRFLLGVGEGAFPASASVAIVDNFQKQTRARAKSVISAGASVGFAVGSVAVTLLLTSIGWNWMFFVFGVIGILLAVIFWFVLQSSEEKKDTQKVKKQNKVPIKSLLKLPLIWKLMIAAFFTNIVFWGLQSWLPSYWVKVKGMDMVSMGAYSSIPYILGFISFLVSGWILDKFMVGREKYMFIIGAFLSAIFIYLMFNSQSIPLAFTYLSLSNVFLNAMNITVFVLPLKHISEDSVGTATGIINTGAQIGSILTPTIMGFLINAFDQNYNVAFMFLVASALAVLIVGITINTKKKIDDLNETTAVASK
ncbi:MFS transporter [Peribacillus simplex]|uniref:MFS transporter n=2 Tax=Peribacillus simplex TaxID=1478 RepID=A0A223ECB7_9BACI|nr:MFS transporter [Peribacillus simplex]ASS92886.1 MFS transporter [Peribacillus simplex NBRC 15720 = DSM 1321]MEC1400530.1 MFS transporter [Peribacillus simplex]MED3911944.1 MFS transporter [Peribacillus simplex]MED3983502.1 MFS transporter [Peribacillus simplex]MED4097507.1 MFS transporter [Peribacillus simplex]